MRKIILSIALIALLFSFSTVTSGSEIVQDPEKEQKDTLSENNITIQNTDLLSIQDEEEDKNEKRRRDRRRFTPHWSSFEIGLNNYLTSDFSTNLPDNEYFMDINTGKSLNININFAQLGIGLSRYFGLVTGLGLEFNNYHFNGNNNIMKNELGVIVEYDAGADGIYLDKSKLSTTYFVIPVLLEAQLPVNRYKTINLAAGVISGAKIFSHTKMKYYENGKKKIKEKDDYSLNILRYGPTVRLGYECFQIYATYYLNTLFKENKGPELYPIQIGLSFTFD